MGRATIERLSFDDDTLWIEDGGRPQGYPIGSMAMRHWLTIAKDCINACTGAADPQPGELARLRAVLKAIKTHQCPPECRPDGCWDFNKRPECWELHFSKQTPKEVPHV
jgi:hypothetical protein